MENWKRILTLLILTFVGLAFLSLGIGVLFTELIVDFWWHVELGLREFFWLKLLYRYILAGAVTAFFFLIFFLNFWAASRYLGVDEDRLATLERPEMTRRQKVLNLFRSGSMHVYIPLSLILAILIAIPFYKDWHAALLFVFGPQSGVKDFVFGQDVSFFLFAYPVFQLIQKEMLIAFTVLSLAMAILYWLEHRISTGGGKSWASGAKIHLTVLALVTTLILAWGFLLERYRLLYTEDNEPQFFGPGFVELNYTLPLIWLSIDRKSVV